MSEQFHDYKFKVKELSKTDSLLEYHKIKVCCRKYDNNEACIYSNNGGGDYSLYLQDRFFNFTIDNKTKRVSAFDGDIVCSQLKPVKLQLPTTVKDVILSVDTQDNLEKGCGGYIKFNTSKIFYDKKNKILQIGDINPKDITYKFFDNGYTQIKNDSLSGLMFTEMDM